MFYGTAVWDPWLIVAQIVCFQCLYYLTLGIFMTILVGTRVSRISLVYFFDYATVTASTVTGWCVIASFILSSLAGAGFLLYLIERAKKCLDFSATLYIVHLLICIIYGGWPSSITWWVVNVTGLAVMALLGEYLCIRRELREIPISKFDQGQSVRRRQTKTWMSKSLCIVWIIWLERNCRCFKGRRKHYFCKKIDLFSILRFGVMSFLMLCWNSAPDIRNLIPMFDGVEVQQEEQLS